MGRPNESLVDDLGRECTKCFTYKTWDNYLKNGKAKTGHQASCKQCKREAANIKLVEKQKAKGINDEGRICEECYEYKLWVKFPNRKTKTNGVNPKYCKACQKVKYEATPSHHKNLKANDWFTWRARSLRSRWRARCKDVKRMDEIDDIPIANDIRDWLVRIHPFRCYYSGKLIANDDVNFDHATPVSRGGSFKLNNVVPTTAKMNGLKGEMLETDFIELLQLANTWTDKGKALFALINRGKLMFQRGARRRK